MGIFSFRFLRHGKKDESCCFFLCFCDRTQQLKIDAKILTKSKTHCKSVFFPIFNAQIIYWVFGRQKRV